MTGTRSQAFAKIEIRYFGSVEPIGIEINLVLGFLVIHCQQIIRRCAHQKLAGGHANQSYSVDWGDPGLADLCAFRVPGNAIWDTLNRQGRSIALETGSTKWIQYGEDAEKKKICPLHFWIRSFPAH
jgi:hypothetical protein